VIYKRIAHENPLSTVHAINGEQDIFFVFFPECKNIVILKNTIFFSLMQHDYLLHKVYTGGEYHKLQFFMLIIV